ncbi:pectinesterase family protein [Sphingomonas sp. HT-1]|uniref:pectinesterase family protein n=1 Tax=unclassified Sphingomonas TaxID=196159 RepID=UPI0013661E6F|nr:MULTISPECIES: pectinesterase family protein [unclassified Sphingomonas]
MATPRRWDIIVDRRGGAGTVGTLGEALRRAEAAGGRPVSILLRAGLWREKQTITVPNLTLAGAGPETVIAFDAHAGGSGPEGRPWGTSGSATLAIAAPGVTLRDLTIRNDFDYIGTRRDAAGNGAQAVALRIDATADRTQVRNCRIEGYQDTLYIQSRAHLAHCRVAGGVDFIFGGGAAWIERCSIVTRHVPGAVESGFIAAPSTPADQTHGLVFADCRLEHEPGVPERSAWLGRPWRAGGNMALTGHAVFLRCWMDAHIQHAGWTSMGYKAPDGSRTMLTPQEARLFEFASRGPGAGPAGPTRRMLTVDEARSLTRASVLGDWAGGGQRPS